MRARVKTDPDATGSGSWFLAGPGLIILSVLAVLLCVTRRRCKPVTTV